jgi:lipopolysaccharide transport system permease protein
MLVIYTFVFSVIFKARWSGGSDSKIEFALLLFSGLIVFNVFAECLNRAPGLILANQNYVKKVIFPLEILPWVIIGSALFHTLVSLGVWLLAYFIFFGLPPITILLIPLIFIPFILFIAGFVWFIASLGVYFRDLSQFIGIVTSALMFMSPIFYPLSAIPEDYRYLFELNPIGPVIEQTRNALFFGISPSISLLIVNFLSGALIAFFGFYWFQKTRKGFADVL